MMRKTLEYMADHLPDVSWRVSLLGIWAPNDEIFEPQFQYVRQRDVIDLEFDNEDLFWTSMPALSEHDIRTKNRVRVPIELRQELALKKLEQKKRLLAE